MTLRSPPFCPLCLSHRLEIVVMVGTVGEQRHRLGVDGRCNGCGFHARRSVEPLGDGRVTSMVGRVETVLLDAPDEPEPTRLAEFEAVADAHLTGGRGTISNVEADLVQRMAEIWGTRKP